MNYEKEFWLIIKKSGKNCDDINNIRKKLKKTKGKDFVNNIDKIFDKYYSMIWAKFEPIIGNFYKENSSVFRNYVFHILSKGKEKLDRFLDNDVKNSKFRDISKFTVEYNILKKLFFKISPYQIVEVLKTNNFGNILVIDNDIQLSESDEANYHEMIAHVPINYFDKNIDVLIIGAGDGGTAREVLKHRNVNSVTMVELDSVVIEAARKFFPNFSPTFSHSKLNLIICDGYKWVEDNMNKRKFDLVIIDSTDFNQSIPLFSDRFYMNLKNIVRDRYIICFNADNINWNKKNIIDMVKTQYQLFEYVKPYTVYIPTFAGGQYSFCMVSDIVNFENLEINWTLWKEKNIYTQYYNKDIHIGSYALPNSLKLELDKLKKNKTIKTGIHYLLDINQVNRQLLDDEIRLKKIFKRFINNSQIKVLGYKYHKFQPQGLTGLYLLSESHISFHTWPEYDKISIDIYTCELENDKLINANIKNMIRSFSSKSYQFNKIIR